MLEPVVELREEVLIIVIVELFELATELLTELKLEEFVMLAYVGVESVVEVFEGIAFIVDVMDGIMDGMMDGMMDDMLDGMIDSMLDGMMDDMLDGMMDGKAATPPAYWN